MNTQPFTIERTLNASVDRVWKALTDKDQMKEWYFDLSEFKATPGFEFHFNGGSDDKVYVHNCKIVEVVEGKRLSYSWAYQGYEGNSLVTFELFKEGEKTRLKLTHEGLETFPQNNPAFARDSFAQGWTHIIGTSLPAFLEK